MNALKSYLGSELSIRRTLGFADMASYKETPAMTQMHFVENLESGHTSVFIHLYREGKGHLTLNEIILPPKRERLDILFRAIVTAARAECAWKADTPAANDTDTQALRRSILAEYETVDMDFIDSSTNVTDHEKNTPVFETEAEACPGPSSTWESQTAAANIAKHSARIGMHHDRLPHVSAPVRFGTEATLAAELAALPVHYIPSQAIERPSPGAFAPIPAKIDAAPDNAGFLEIQAMAARYDREQIDLAIRVAGIGESIARSMANISDCRRHNTSPIGCDTLETEAEAAPQPAAPCRQGKRRLSNESAEIMPPPKRHDNANTSNR